MEFSQNSVVLQRPAKRPWVSLVPFCNTATVVAIALKKPPFSSLRHKTSAKLRNYMRIAHVWNKRNRITAKQAEASHSALHL